MTPIKSGLAGLFVTAALTFAAGSAWAVAGVDFPSHSVKEAQEAVDEGKYEKAVGMLEEIQRFEPDNAEVANLLGYSKRNLGDFEAAMTNYKRALEIDPAHKGTLEYQGELFLKLGDKASADKNLAKLQEACPKGCEPHAMLQAAIERFKDGKFAWSAHVVSTASDGGN